MKKKKSKRKRKPIVNWLVGLIDKYVVEIDSVTKVVKDCDIDIEIKP